MDVLGKMDNCYSVLMSVYVREKAERLRSAMNSIWEQTVSTDDFVLVCDGPLNAELNDVICEMQREHDALRVIRLDRNKGLGNALNIGIKECRHELVARMDSDDISRPERCERQLRVFLEHPEISICSGTVEEFETSIEEIEARRVLPETHEDIVEFAKKRNPFNHPCVMYKKSAVEMSGGYQEYHLLEDYYLWIRMILKGCIGYNIQDPLLWMRAGSDMYKRRSGWKYVQSQRRLMSYMKKTGFINRRQFVLGGTKRTIVALLPNCIRSILYKKLLRK